MYADSRVYTIYNMNIYAIICIYVLYHLMYIKYSIIHVGSYIAFSDSITYVRVGIFWVLENLFLTLHIYCEYLFI